MQVNIVVVGQTESGTGCPVGGLEVVDLLRFQEVSEVTVVVELWLVFPR